MIENIQWRDGSTQRPLAAVWVAIQNCVEPIPKTMLAIYCPLLVWHMAVLRPVLGFIYLQLENVRLENS